MLEIIINYKKISKNWKKKIKKFSLKMIQEIFSTLFLDIKVFNLKIYTNKNKI